MKKTGIILGAILVLIVGVALVGRELIFPLKYEAKIEKYSKEYKVEPELVAAIINIRSSFNPKEYEKGKECGPMALQDKSVEVMVKEIGLKDFKIEKLADPDINIKIGTWFIAKNYKDKDITKLAEKLGGMNWQDAKPNTKQEEKKKFWENYYKQYFSEKIKTRAKIYNLLYPTL